MMFCDLLDLGFYYVVNEERTAGSVYDKWNIPVVICDTDIP
jgi:hypothetical protein